MFVFDSAKVARPSSDPLIEPATSFTSPIFRTHPHGYNFFLQIPPRWYWTHYWQMCINSTYALSWWLRQSPPMALLEDHPDWYPWSTGSTEHMKEKNSPWSRSGQEETHKSQQKQELRQSSSIILILTPNSVGNWRFSNWWCEFYRDQNFLPSCAKASHTNLSPFPISTEPLNPFQFPFSGVSYRVTHNA